MPDMMGKMDIAFPHLGIYLTNVPKSFQIGNYTIALYGIVMALSMLAGMLIAAWVAKKTGQNPDTYWDCALYLIIFALIGARLYYVIFFWEEGGYAQNPLSILNLHQGGLGLYGSVIGGLVTLVVYAKIKKKKLLEMTDTVAYGMILGQIIGRWANFFNREVFGRYTDSLLAMRLPIEMVRQRDIDSTIASHIVEGTNYIQVHPTFLYESLWNLGVLIIMLILMRRKRFTGEITLVYFIGYGLGRAWIEYIRTDQLYLIGTDLPVSMVLGLGMFVGCGIVLIADFVLAHRGKLEMIDYSKVPEFVKPAKDEAKDEVKEETKDEANDVAGDEANDVAGDEAKNAAENAAINAAKNEAKDAAKNEAKNAAVYGEKTEKQGKATNEEATEVEEEQAEETKEENQEES